MRVVAAPRAWAADSHGEDPTVLASPSIADMYCGLDVVHGKRGSCVA